MSGGEQQMLAIGRALMGRPKLLLLDEPSMGIAPILVERIYETIAEINQQGTTILLVEQNANFALGVSQRGYVLETGTVALADESAALRENPEVQKAYLGHMTDLRPHRRQGAVAAVRSGCCRRSSPRTCPSRKGYGERAGLASGLLLSRHRRRSSGWSGRRSRSRSGRRSARVGRAQGRREGDSAPGVGAVRDRGCAPRAARQHVALPARCGRSRAGDRRRDEFRAAVNNRARA